MSVEVNKAFVQKFRDSWIHLAQQQGSKLRETVRVHENVVGKYDHFDRVGSTSARIIASRHADTPLIDTPHSRRRIVLSDYNWADLVDRADEQKMLSSPTSEYLKAGVWAMGRKIDDVIISSFDGNSTSISADDSSSSVSFASGNSIADGNTGLTLAKITNASKLLSDSDVDPDEDRYFVVSPAAVEDMLNTTGITSADYNSVRVLMDSKISNFMGFRWIMSTRLPVDSSDIRSCFAYTKSAMGLSIGMDIITSIDKRPDKNNSLQPYAQMSIGATRIEEEKIVRVYVDETPD